MQRRNRHPTLLAARKAASYCQSVITKIFNIPHSSSHCLLVQMKVLAICYIFSQLAFYMLIFSHGLIASSQFPKPSNLTSEDTTTQSPLLLAGQFLIDLSKGNVVYTHSKSTACSITILVLCSLILPIKLNLPRSG
jgi:hypothetical protein